MHKNPRKEELQERARQEKEEAGRRNRGSYRAYRRVGLKPFCALRFMLTHSLKRT